MAQVKSDLSIAIKVGNKAFTLNCVHLPDNRFMVKRGRNISQKMPYATLSEIFDAARKFAVKQIGL